MDSSIFRRPTLLEEGVAYIELRCEARAKKSGAFAARRKFGECRQALTLRFYREHLLHITQAVGFV